MSKSIQAVVPIPKSVDIPSGVEGDHWALFLSRLQTLTAMTYERRHRGHFINIHRNSLRQLMGERYRERIDAMREAGVIEVNSSYSTGRSRTKAFTKSYRLATQYRSGWSRLHELRSRPSAKKVLRSNQPDERNLGPSGMHFRRNFERFSLSSDAATDPRLKSHWDQWTIARWQNRQEFARRCDYRRYHGLVTQLPRKARCHLRVDSSDELALVDVSACQPLLLGYLAASRSWSGLTTGSGTEVLPYVVGFLRRQDAPSDVRRWIELSESREIYGYFQDAIRSFDGPTVVKMSLPSGQVVERDLKQISERSFKRATLVPAFDKLEPMKRSPIFKIIQRDFPTIAAFILYVKQEKHQRLACLLQRTESALMIDGVGGVLAKQFPDVPVQPIHDALLVPASFAVTAKNLIAQQFRAVGLEPKVSIEAC